METVWRHVYGSVLRAEFAAQPLLLTEAPLNPRRNRERLAETLFESCGVPGLMLCTPANLALYASGRTTGLCFDVGEGVTCAVPVVNGFALPHATTRTDVGGKDVTDQLQALLRRAPLPQLEPGHEGGGGGGGGGGSGGATRRGADAHASKHPWECRPRSYHTSSEYELVRRVKESQCFVAFDLEKEETYEYGFGRGFKLPDGLTLEMGAEVFRAPEVLFDPARFGSTELPIQQCLTHAISRVDVELRHALCSDIILTGGSTGFHLFQDRLVNEVRKILPKTTLYTKNLVVVDPGKDAEGKDRMVEVGGVAVQRRTLDAWLGGAILASLSTFADMWLTRADFEEHGAAVALARKSF